MITSFVFVAVSLYLISGNNLLLREGKFGHTSYPHQESQNFPLRFIAVEILVNVICNAVTLSLKLK
jgi:hypothetical protein